MTETQRDEQVDDAPALPVPKVEHLLSTIEKALRAFNMYQPNNPVFQRFRKSLREALKRCGRRRTS